MEILVGLIPFVLVALIVWLVARFTRFTALDIFMAFLFTAAALSILVMVLILAYVIGSAILDGVGVA